MTFIQSITSYLSFAAVTCARCGAARSRFGGARCKVCGLPKGGLTPAPEATPAPEKTAVPVIDRKRISGPRVRRAA